MPATDLDAPDGSHADSQWELTGGAGWFLRVWDLLFVLLIAVGTTRGFWLDLPSAHAWVVVAMATATTLWYLAPLLARPAGGVDERTHSWLAGVVIGAVTLSAMSPDFAWLAFPIAFQLGYRLRVVTATMSGFVLAVAAMAGLARPDWTLRLAELIGPTLGIAMAIVVAIGYRTVLAQRDHNRQLLDQLATTQDQLAQVERDAGIAQERARLSREIHDTLAQGLASSLLLVQAAAHQMADQTPAAKGHLVEVERQLRDGLEDARRFVRDLAPAALDDTPLTESLHRLCRDQTSRPTEVRFEVIGEPRQLPTDHEVALYRTAQEALTNVRKHAQAQHVRITLTYLDDATLLDIVDDGAGCDPTTPTDGLGLLGLNDRLRHVGGHLDLEAEPGNGTALAATIPLDPGPLANDR